MNPLNQSFEKQQKSHELFTFSNVLIIFIEKVGPIVFVQKINFEFSVKISGYRTPKKVVIKKCLYVRLSVASS